MYKLHIYPEKYKDYLPSVRLVRCSLPVSVIPCQEVVSKQTSRDEQQ
jgi:hypothetical protein